MQMLCWNHNKVAKTRNCVKQLLKWTNLRLSDVIASNGSCQSYQGAKKYTKTDTPCKMGPRSEFTYLFVFIIRSWMFKVLHSNSEHQHLAHFSLASFVFLVYDPLYFPQLWRIHSVPLFKNWPQCWMKIICHHLTPFWHLVVTVFLSPCCGLVWLGDGDTSVKQAEQRADTVPEDNSLSLMLSPSLSSKHKGKKYIYMSL